MIKNLPIKQKIIASLAMMAALSILVMIVSLNLSNYSTEREKKANKHYEKATLNLTEFTENFLLARVWLRDVNLFSQSESQSKIDESIQKFTYFSQKMAESKNKYYQIASESEFYGTHDVDSFINQFKQDYKAFENVAVAIFENIKKGNYKLAAKMISEDCHNTAERLLDTIHKAHEMETQLVHDNITNTKNEANKIYSIFYAGIFFVLALFCFIIYTTLNNLIVKPIVEASAHFSKMAGGDWNLSKKMDVTQKDEIGSLFVSLNTFVDVLDNLIKQVMSSSKDIVTESNGLNHVAQQTGQALDDQRHLTDRAANSIEEMTDSVKKVAENAENAASAAAKAKTQSDVAATILNTTMQSITTLGGQIQSSSSVIDKLKSESESISKVLDVIKGIAEQTNLLALNAAIEAARAGDQGRGFAVVADEVRTLAQRTQGSTSEIQTLIVNLQNGSASAVKEMEKSQQSVNDANEQATKISSAMEDILASISLISKMNSQIAITTEQQSTAVQGVSQNILDIKAISEKTEKGSEATSQSGVSLNKLSIELEDQLVIFKR